MIIDGLGVGAMPDVTEVRPKDVGANTLAHVAEREGKLKLPFLERLGIGNLGDFSGIAPVKECLADYGKCMLAHNGADTYMGHQELMGSNPPIVTKQTMNELSIRLKAHLESKGHSVQYPLKEYPLLLVDNYALIADNMEADPGQTLIVTCSLEQMEFDQLLVIGQLVREVTRVSRVIVGASQGFDIDTILDNITTTTTTVGVDMPKLGIFDEHLRVRHLGYPVDISRQLPTIAVAAGRPVVILGKAADVVQCQGATLDPIVDTDGVFNALEQHLAAMDEGLFVCNIQQTDHSGHEQDSQRYANILGIVDRRLEQLYCKRQASDFLIITGDHGNDPTIGHSQHTREMTPLLVVNPLSSGSFLGIRKSLADVAATASRIMMLPDPEYGTSWL